MLMYYWEHPWILSAAENMVVNEYLYSFIDDCMTRKDALTKVLVLLLLTSVKIELIITKANCKLLLYHMIKNVQKHVVFIGVLM